MTLYILSSLCLYTLLHRYEAPCSPSSYCESDIPSSPSCSKDPCQSSSPVQLSSCQSSSPRDREASTSPTTSAIKTVQNILASLHAAQTPLTQLVALQAPLSPWSSLGLPLAPGLQGLASLSSEAGNMQQLYLQHHHHALQQTLHTLMPPYTHPSGQTQTMMLQNQVR